MELDKAKKRVLDKDDELKAHLRISEEYNQDLLEKYKSLENVFLESESFPMEEKFEEMKRLDFL